jgi:very-short-patch-repair endonuclease
MRHNLSKKHSTKPERIFHEVLKELNIPFKHRWLIHGLEVDFLLWDKVCIDLDGHPQNGERNHRLASYGYTPVHLANSEVSKENIKTLILNLNGSN